MPNFGYVEANPQCPACGAVLTDLVSFQWGYLPGYQPRAGRIYQVGDPILWRVCRDGSVPGWVFFRGGEDDDACNAGEPGLLDLYALDTQQTWLAESCLKCGQPMGGAVVEIRGGIIVRAFILPAGGLGVASPSGLLRIAADGQLLPIPEPVMSTRGDCGPLAFWGVQISDGAGRGGASEGV
jgi:hypothetical protein